MAAPTSHDRNQVPNEIGSRKKKAMLKRGGTRYRAVTAMAVSWIVQSDTNSREHCPIPPVMFTARFPPPQRENRNKGRGDAVVLQAYRGNDATLG